MTKIARWKMVFTSFWGADQQLDVNQHLGISCFFFFSAPFFPFSLFLLQSETKNYKLAKNAKKQDFYQQIRYAAPVRWWKYTTLFFNFWKFSFSGIKASNIGQHFEGRPQENLNQPPHFNDIFASTLWGKNRSLISLVICNLAIQNPDFLKTGFLMVWFWRVGLWLFLWDNSLIPTIWKTDFSKSGHFFLISNVFWQY